MRLRSTRGKPVGSRAHPGIANGTTARAHARNLRTPSQLEVIRRKFLDTLNAAGG